MDGKKKKKKKIQWMAKPETGDTIPLTRDNAFHVKHFVIKIDTFLYTAEVDCIEFETMLRNFHASEL